MKQNPFVHLHLHTSYSLLDGACRIPNLMEAVSQAGMGAVAITDHGAMYGAIDFYRAAKELGIKPIIGCEVYVAAGDRKEKKANQAGSNHLVLLAADQTGYFNLMQLVTAAHLEGFYYKPRIDKQILSEYGEGLIGLSACLKGRVAECLMKGNREAAKKEAAEYADILGKDNFFIEIQDHGIKDQRRINPELIKIASELGLPLVATNDVHYIKKEDTEAHEILLCMQTGTVMSDPNRMKYDSSEFYLKSGAEMSALFKDLPEAVENTLEIARRCNVEISFNETHFPKFPVTDGRSLESYFEQLCSQGVRAKYGIEDLERPKNDFEKKVVERMRYEIQIIERTGFIGYFLVVWDAVRFAREKNIPVGLGRGSGAASLVSYVLGITGVEPLSYSLVFERFLNPERVTPPDFDIDFCQTRRGEVIEYVRNKYGRDNVAQIITFGSLGAKTVLRDVGRVLEIPLGECDAFAKKVPDDPKITLEKAMDQNPEFKQICQTDPNAKKILKYALVLEGLFRHSGTHAAGVVFGGKPLKLMVPLSRDRTGEILTQYSKDHVDALGLLKADFLGLKTLTVIDESIKLIEKRKKIKIDIESIPMDDPPTLDLLNLGNTIGVFQLESRGMRDLIRRIGINKIEDLIATVALFRPGPMNMLDDYVNRKMGRIKIKYDHKLLEPILAETYGVMLYQEQVQQAAHVLAGFSLGQGDLLRRAMGKKKQEEMEQQRKVFIEGCKKQNKIPADKAEKIFENISKFAGYGFNKSHSTGYAIIAYQTAWLKAHYPEEFMAALLSSEMGNADKLPVFIAEAKQMELDVLPPDVNESEVRFKPLDKAIRFGLAGIKNVGEGAATSIVQEREKDGPFKGLMDFCSRVDTSSVNKKSLETLVRCGAFDFSGYHRARLFEGVGMAVSRGDSVRRDRLAGQTTLFSLMDGMSEVGSSEDFPDCPQWHKSEIFSAEKELLGIYMTGHPLLQYEQLIGRYCLSSVDGVMSLDTGALTRVGGLITQLEKRITKKKQEPFATFRIEAIDASLDVVVLPKYFSAFNSLLAENSPVMVCGKVARDGSSKDDIPKLMAFEIYSMDSVPGLFSTRLNIHLSVATLKDDQMDKLKALLKSHPGRVPVSLCLLFPAGEEVFINAGSAFSVNPSEGLIRSLSQTLGEDAFYVAVKKSPCLTEVNSRNDYARQRT